MICLKDFKKNIGNLVIFDKISFSFNDTGFYSVYGPNGCGKTTFLLILGLFDLKYDGSFTINDKEVKNLTKRELKFLQDNVVYVASRNDLFSFLNVKENLNISKGNYIVDIDDISNERVDLLSGGESQLVSFYQKINLNAKIFLFDESINMLDQKNKKMVLEAIKNKSKEALCIMATHDDIVKNYCDKILCFK